MSSRGYANACSNSSKLPGCLLPRTSPYGRSRVQGHSVTRGLPGFTPVGRNEYHDRYAHLLTRHSTGLTFTYLLRLLDKEDNRQDTRGIIATKDCYYPTASFIGTPLSVHRLGASTNREDWQPLSSVHPTSQRLTSSTPQIENQSYEGASWSTPGSCRRRSKSLCPTQLNELPPL